MTVARTTTPQHTVTTTDGSIQRRDVMRAFLAERGVDLPEHAQGGEVPVANRRGGDNANDHHMR